MEFSCDVNHIFPQRITRTVGTSLPHSKRSQRAEDEQKFAAVVNEMGIASARAQGLHAPITTAQKLQSSNHILYVLKDEHSNSGKGAVVGILKVGYKRLFLNDPCGVQHEVEPLCVLDFYVHESRQRSGCGKKLFEAMLQAERVKPFEVAIDRPSPKFLSFLKKHYKLQSFVKQANNYVVCDQFFSTCVDVGPGLRRLSLDKQSQSLSPSQPSWWRHSAHLQVAHTLGSSPRRFPVAPVERPSPLTTKAYKNSSVHRTTSPQSPAVHSPSANAAKRNNKDDSLPQDFARSTSWHSCNDFNWSPECVSRRLAVARDLGNHNIITGVPQNSHTSSDQKQDGFLDSGTTNNFSSPPWAGSSSDSKAPFLTMRSQHRGRSGIHSVPHSDTQSLGFYSATGSGQASNRMEAIRYSRHSSSSVGETYGTSQYRRVSGKDLKSGLSGTPLATRTSSQTADLSLRGRKLRDNWKSYLI